MTIETNLNRIADALEGILGKLSHIDQAVAPVITEADCVRKSEPEVLPKKVVKSKPSPAPAVEVTPPPPPAVEVTPPPPPAVEVTMTPDELNAALVIEFGRLGSRNPIDTVMREMGVGSIHDLKPEQYSVLIEKVKAL